jgi:hypothetical protein
MVVLAKLVFSETVDDEIEKIRAKLAQNKAKEYLEALNSRHHSIQLDIQRALSN